MAKQLFTIGYAGFPDIHDFVLTLQKNGIQILIDVRSTPYSAHFESYNKDNLSRILKENGIFYANYARQFGARQDNKALYKDGRLDFETFSKSNQFLEGVNNVEKSNAVIAFMCAEKRPSECHRTILVAKAFTDRGHEVTHIIANGRSITQHDVEQELLQKYFPNREQESLFDDGYSNRVIRLVQNRRGAPVENPYCDLFEPLDCFELTVTESCPILCQTENVLSDYHLAHEHYLGKYDGSIQDIYKRFQSIDYGDTSFMLDGSYKIMDISPFKHSLELISVSRLTIEGGKCSFLHKNNFFQYVSITDPKYKMPTGVVKEIGDAILAISIPTENYKEKGYYKFVASIFPTGKLWTKEEDEDLLYELHHGWTLQIMCAAHKRTEEEIRKRLSILQRLSNHTP